MEAIMRVGIIGTGAISHKHAQAYQNIGYQVAVCTDINQEAGRRFAATYGAEFVAGYEDVCRHPQVDFVDVCTFPDFRLEPVKACARSGTSSIRSRSVGRRIRTTARRNSKSSRNRPCRTA
jgi:predicted dehydrogenase